MELDLKNKVFFIAGASQGIGLGIADSLLSEGANVVITGRNKEKLKLALNNLKEKFGHKNVVSISGDMQEMSVIENNLEFAIEKFSRIDGFIANIGNGSESLYMDETSDFWDNSYAVNLKSSLNQVQCAQKYLQKSKGVIIFISSIAGMEDIGAPIAYSTFKAGLNMAAKKLSRDLAQYGIRVNVIAPGNIYFEGGVWSKKMSKNKNKILSYIEREVPMQCFGESRDIGDLCAFLCSPRSKFITGSIITIDGGQTHGY